MFEISYQASLYWAVILFTVTAALIDWSERRVPNWLTVSGVALAFSFYGILHGLPGLLFAAKGFATGFGLLLLLWLIGGGGGGDVKLMGALGALLGVKLTLVVFVLSTFLTIVALAATAAVRLFHSPAGRPATSNDPVSTQPAPQRTIPYAIPVAGAAWLTILWQAATI